MKRAPFVDLVFGPQTLHRLPAMIARGARGHAERRRRVVPRDREVRPDPEAEEHGLQAFLSVMEGCSKACTYCIVPTTRGEEISRPLDDVIAEARRLAELGAREITLLGQNVNAYRGAMPGGGTADLADLIYVVAEIDGVERIRFTTSHPADFDDSLVAPTPNVDKLVSYLHLPVQSGSDRVLKLMKRGYTAAKYVGEDRQGQARAARHLDRDRHDRRFPGRDRAGLRADARAHAARRLRPVVHLYI